MKAQTKALVASVVVIALALTAVSGITYSWWSDSESGDISITTGKLSVDTADFTVTWGVGESDKFTSPSGKVPETLSISCGGTDTTDVKLPQTLDPGNLDLTISYNVTFNATIAAKYLVNVTIPEGVTATPAVKVGIEDKTQDVLGKYLTDNSGNLSVIYTVTVHVTAIEMDINGKFAFTNYITQAANSNAMSAEGAVSSNAATIENDKAKVNATSLPNNAQKFVVAVTTDDTEKTASIDLTLIDDNSKKITQFDTPVQITVVLKGVYNGLYYNGNGEQPSSVEYKYSTDGTTFASTDITNARYTQIIFSTSHFSEFVTVKTEAVSSVEALERAITQGGFVRLGADLSADVVIKENTLVVLDLNGMKLTASSSNTITNNGILSIIDSSNDKKGSVVCNVTGKANVFNNPSGMLYIDSGNYSRSAGYYVIKNTGECVINGGDFSSSSPANSMIVNGFQSFSEYKSLTKNVSFDASDVAKMTINGGKFTCNDSLNSVLKNDEASHLIVNGGEFIGNPNWILMNWDVAVLNGGSFTVSGSDQTFIFASGSAESSLRSTGDLAITGGKYSGFLSGTSNIDQYIEESTVTISGGSVVEGNSETEFSNIDSLNLMSGCKLSFTKVDNVWKGTWNPSGTE